MPAKVLGKPVDEEKWSRAKARAAEEGHEGNYAYIMSIYKKMAHLGEHSKTEKSIVDSGSLSAYNKSSELKLVIGSNTDFDEFRCGTCGKLLLKGVHLEKSILEIKCLRCGTVNIN